MPEMFGVPVVSLLVCFFHSHTRLRVCKAPGIPCALFAFEGGSSKPRVQFVPRDCRCLTERIPRATSGSKLARHNEQEPPYEAEQRANGSALEKDHGPEQDWSLLSCKHHAAAYANLHRPKAFEQLQAQPDKRDQCEQHKEYDGYQH
jgi:hypothetical protein